MGDRLGCERNSSGNWFKKSLPEPPCATSAGVSSVGVDGWSTCSTACSSIFTPYLSCF